MSAHSPLSVRKLGKCYGALRAVDDVSFDVGDGEIIGFCGPNGAGKTTMFDLISGLTMADTGDVLVDGEKIAANRPDLRVDHGLARTFQLNAAFDSLSVADNLRLALTYSKRSKPATRAAGDARVLEIARRFGLQDILNVPASLISVLQSKILMLACAYAANPRFILLDEPVAGLSHSEIDEFQQIVLDLRAESGITFLVIEHVMPFLMGISSRVIFLHNGSIEFDGAPQELVRNSQIVALYLGETVAAMLAEDA
ncbi:ABC transporter ATP-binding protein [Brucella grignonensis]|uniref:ABC transporter ATP-binding protein n=1 Tax=Brucella grignonensis TaxID=94627 RepID=UPI0035BC655C